MFKYLFPLVFLSSVLTASGQDTASIRFRVVGVETNTTSNTLSRPANPPFYYFDGSEIVEFYFPTNRISASHDFRGKLPIRIYSEPPFLDDEGALTGGKLVSAINPEGDPRDILVFGFGLSREQPKLISLNATRNSEDQDVVYVLNVSPQRALLRLGSKRIYMDRGAVDIIEKDDLDIENGLLQIAVEESEADRWEVVYSKYTPISATGSFFVLIHREHLNAGKWKVMALLDREMDREVKPDESEISPELELDPAFQSEGRLLEPGP